MPIGRRERNRLRWGWIARPRGYGLGVPAPPHSLWGGRAADACRRLAEQAQEPSSATAKAACGHLTLTVALTLTLCCARRREEVETLLLGWFNADRRGRVYHAAHKVQLAVEQQFSPRDYQPWARWGRRGAGGRRRRRRG